MCTLLLNQLKAENKSPFVAHHDATSTSSAVIIGIHVVYIRLWWWFVKRYGHICCDGIRVWLELRM